MANPWHVVQQQQQMHELLSVNAQQIRELRAEAKQRAAAAAAEATELAEFQVPVPHLLCVQGCDMLTYQAALGCSLPSLLPASLHNLQ